MEDRLNIPQMEASDPEASVWTMASAGTGKTTVLIARLMKLLLKGAKPSKILCLTFTNTAASEIRSRINREIARWSNYSDIELRKLIHMLFGNNLPKHAFEHARNLGRFGSTDTVRVCTIHSFCQYVLSRFPIEAGIAPAFRVIDEMLSSQILRQLKAKVIEGNGCKEAIDYFARNFHESKFDQILSNATSGKFANILSSFSSEQEYREHLASLMQIKANLTERQIIEQHIDSLPASLPLSKLEGYLLLDRDEKIRKWRDLSSIFLDSKGLPRKALDSKPESASFLQRFQESFLQTLESVNRLSSLNASVHLFCLAKELMNLYSSHKKLRGCLDYGDLISLAANLFTSSEDRDWVLYKLDGGIDHVLIDEAQDTSTDQWKVIIAIIEDFFSSAQEQNMRSIFVVGDVKQSIYSFQGARVESLHEVQRYVASNLARTAYKEVDLLNCYRSSQTVIDFIKRALEVSPAEFSVPSLSSVRDTQQGRIEVWPAFFSQNSKPSVFWPLPDEGQQKSNGKGKFAQIIASYVKSLLQQGIVLPSTGLSIRESDITILVQRRNEFTRLLADALREKGIAVSGLDRVSLRENLTILDIIAIAKFVLLPSDNLNCAILLKSPLLSFTEEEVFDLSRFPSIWEGLANSAHANARLLLERFIEIYAASSIFDFFYAALDVMNCREKLLKGNEETSDIVDEFLTLVKQFESQVADDLYRFVEWFLSNDVEVKRDVSEDGFVKIMTVHACKGMESGVVIIPDALSLDVKEHTLCTLDEAVFLVRHESEFTKGCKRLRQKVDYQEYLRLMYVAFTRCKDYLIICGHCSNKTVSALSWHSIARKAIDGIGTLESIDCLKGLDFAEKVSVFQREPFKRITLEKEKQLNSRQAIPLPEGDICFELKSQGDGQSPLKADSSLYGTLIHKLLESLVNGVSFKEALEHPIAATLSDHVKSKLQQVKSLLASELLSEAEKVFTEVSISLPLASGRVSTLRLDLLIFSKGFVDIVDYKTDSAPAVDAASVSSFYKAQLSNYAEAVGILYPNVPIRCWILWVETVSLMRI